MAGRAFRMRIRASLTRNWNFTKSTRLVPPTSKIFLLNQKTQYLRARVFPPHAVVFAKVGAALLLSRFRQLKRPACLDNNMMGLVVRQGYSPRYVRYALDIVPMTYIVNPGAVPSINENNIGNLRLPGPSLDEQTQIAKFLDYETAKIDALMEKQQQLIELLKEKRQAVISHAVTKGLNPDAPMRDSGVEWLGKVPAHWEVKRLKHISPVVTVGIVVNPSSFARDEGLPFIHGGDIRERQINSQQARRISLTGSNFHAKTKLEEGDVLTVRVGATRGVTAVVPKDCEGGNCASVMLIRKGNFNSEWLCFSMNDTLIQFQIELVEYGAAQPQFNISHAIEFWFPVPGRAEQDAIVDYLLTKTTKLGKLIDGAQETIDLLQERRTALISAAVTGKIDVRGWKPPVSEVEAEVA